ncbi:MAG: hypothetical protein CSA72_02685 [Rhodobacterales bacterium]|nr:MAG: hypothetical protein CSA72_02685 [Rhodobacterales bacterium]
MQDDSRNKELAGIISKVSDELISRLDFWRTSKEYDAFMLEHAPASFDFQVLAADAGTRRFPTEGVMDSDRMLRITMEDMANEPQRAIRLTLQAIGPRGMRQFADQSGMLSFPQADRAPESIDFDHMGTATLEIEVAEDPWTDSTWQMFRLYIATV